MHVCVCPLHVFNNDMLIFGGQTREQHHTIIVRVLDILWKHRLYLKVEKCIFEQPRFKYLSLILSEGHIEMDPKSQVSKTG